MTLILGDSEQIDFHTDLNKLIKPFKKEFLSLNWLLTDQEYVILDSNQKEIKAHLDYESEKIEFEGHELLELIENRNIQFIWGVFCGIKGKIPAISIDELPYADGNSEIWTEPDKFLLEESEFEIICIDSSYSIVKFRDKRLEERFKKEFKDSKN